MAHRDDLEAALQRAEALERQVRELEAKQVIPSERLPPPDPDELSTLRQDLGAARARAERLERRLEELQRGSKPLVKIYSPAEVEEAALEARRGDAAAPPPAEAPEAGPPRNLPRVDHFNRSRGYQPVPEESNRTGVACPRCAEAGEVVEMVEGRHHLTVNGVELRQVVCLRCLWVDHKAG